MADTRTNSLLRLLVAACLDAHVRCNCSAGCKYARGEWSSNCEDGQRVRVDSLVGTLGNATNCKAERRVTKDCKRACHYIKSGELVSKPTGRPAGRPTDWQVWRHARHANTINVAASA